MKIVAYFDSFFCNFDSFFCHFDTFCCNFFSDLSSLKHSNSRGHGLVFSLFFLFLTKFMGPAASCVNFPQRNFLQNRNFMHLYAKQASRNKKESKCLHFCNYLSILVVQNGFLKKFFGIIFAILPVNDSVSP